MNTYQALGGRVLVLKPVGHILGGSETDEFVDLAREFAKKDHVGVLVDFEGVDYMNSLGLGALARILITCSRANGVVRVCNVKGRVRRLFDVVKFDKLFEYHDSEASALEALAKDLLSAV